MGWGDSFANAWNAAGDLGKRAAGAVASGANWVADKGKQAAGWAADRARSATRTAERKVADRVYDSTSGAVETGRSKARSVADAYAKAKAKFTKKPAGAPVQPCPGDTFDHAGDADRDGWIMVPQGPGKPCLALPPSKGAVADARAKAAVADDPCCQARRAGQPPRDIVYVNGINTTAQAHCQTLNQIAQQTCGRVVGVYNATEGGLRDAAQTGQDRRLIKAAQAGKPFATGDARNPAVDTLSRTIDSELAAGRSPEVWAHSQGGAVTSLALYQARNNRAAATLSPDPLKGMTVKSFGAAAPNWPDGPAYEHYVHVNDATPTLFGLGQGDGDDLANAGRGAQVIRFSGVPGHPFEQVAKTDWTPAMTSNHDVAATYLAMEKQVHGGCP